jgi:hypothetical protein
MDTGFIEELRIVMLDPRRRAKNDRDQRQRQAAGHEPAYDAPIHAAPEAMDAGADRLGRCGTEKIAADGGGGMDAEEKDEQGRP